MVRLIVAVIVAYITMFFLNFLGFVGLYRIIGPEQSFKPRSYLASNRWIFITLVIIFMTGAVAGLICAAIARGGKATLALALLVVVLGLLLAIPETMKGRANAGMARPPVITQMEAAHNAYWPIWTPFVFPFVSALGVLVGGRLKTRS